MLYLSEMRAARRTTGACRIWFPQPSASGRSHLAGLPSKGVLACLRPGSGMLVDWQKIGEGATGGFGIFAWHSGEAKLRNRNRQNFWSSVGYDPSFRHPTASCGTNLKYLILQACWHGCVERTGENQVHGKPFVDAHCFHFICGVSVREPTWKI